MTDKHNNTSDEFLDDSVVAEENAHESLIKLRDRLKRCEAERMEYLTGWQRAKADAINARKREEGERSEFVKFANERLMESLIPVLESFDLAMANREAWQKADKNWRVGVEYIYSQLVKALSESGLTEINPVGEMFDHNRDEAAAHVPVDREAENQRIMSVVQKGYRLNGRILRPPKVKVGEFRKF